jgi:hypothetical protein
MSLYKPKHRANVFPNMLPDAKQRPIKELFVRNLKVGALVGALALDVVTLSAQFPLEANDQPTHARQHPSPEAPTYDVTIEP